MQDLIKLEKSIILAINVGTAATLGNVFFKKGSRMQGKRPTKISVLTDSNILLVEGKTPVGSGGLPSLSLTLVNKGNSNEILVDSHPTQLLQQGNDTTSKGMVDISGLSIDWEESYFTKLAATGVSDDEVLAIQVYYE